MFTKPSVPEVPVKLKANVIVPLFPFGMIVTFVNWLAVMFPVICSVVVEWSGFNAETGMFVTCSTQLNVSV